MKLIKVRDNQNRPVNGLDLIMSAVFGDGIPREFISGEYYQAGQHVYKIGEDGSLLIYECNLSGTYLRCEDPGFREWSLDSLIEKYSDAILDIGEITSEPILYESKSVVAESESYEEYDGNAKFVANTDEFNLNDYSGKHDIIDVYLRREHSDSYLAPSDYKFDGSKLSVELPLSDMALISNHTTNFYPQGYFVGGEDSAPLYVGLEEYPDFQVNLNGQAPYYFVVKYDNDPYYWYGENGKVKSYLFTEDGISMENFDILATIGKPIKYGYKICDLKIESVHTIVESPLNKLQDTNVYRLDEFMINGDHDPIGSDIDEKIQTITIPIDVEPTRNLKDELYITLNTETQLINVSCKNGHIKQVKFSLTARKLKPLSAFIIGTKAKSEMAKFINVVNEFGEVVKIGKKNYIKFPCFDLLRYNSFEFELYVNRVYTSNYEEYINDNGEVFIKMLDDDNIDYENDVFLFHIYYSISQGANIFRTSDEHDVLNDKDAFRIFLTTEFINKFQWLKMRQDYKLIPPEVTVGSKTSANITDPNYYLSEGETLRADVFSVVFNKDNRRIMSLTDSCNSESYPIMETTRDITIPFIDYNSEKDDFLIFKSGGILYSSAKWYLNGEDVNIYSHETPLSRGDYLDFRLLDRDENVRVYNRFLDSNGSEPLDIGVDLSNVAFLLLFTISGQFISPSKYTIDGSYITFNSNCNQPFIVDNGTRLEAIYGVFKGDYCKTIYNTLQIVATEDNQREFNIKEDLDFNVNSDNVLIFREDGMYIGERFYHMDEENDMIVIDRGTGVPKGSHIDIVVIRNLSLEIPVTN